MEDIRAVVPTGPVPIYAHTETEFLTDPAHYYSKLIEMLRKTNKKVVLSALYLGTSERELRIIEEIDQSLERYPQLEVTLVLDYSRAMREIRNKTSSNTSDNGGLHSDRNGDPSFSSSTSSFSSASTTSSTSSTLSISNKLIEKYHPRFKIYLYQMPQIQQINSTVGVFHGWWRKLADTVMMTGSGNSNGSSNSGSNSNGKLQSSGALEASVISSLTTDCISVDSVVSSNNNNSNGGGGGLDEDLMSVDLADYRRHHIVPSPIDEALGVYHCKFCIFESETMTEVETGGGKESTIPETNAHTERTVVLTGANLSEEYFISRQDRYLVCTTKTKASKDTISASADPLSVFLQQFTETLTPHCYEITPAVATIGSPADADSSSGSGAGPRIRIRLPESQDNDVLQRNLTDLTFAFSAESTTESGVGASAYAPYISCLPLIQHHGIGLHQESTYLPRLIAAVAPVDAVDSRNSDTNGSFSLGRQQKPQAKIQRSQEKRSLWERIVVTTPYISFDGAMVEALTTFLKLGRGQGQRQGSQQQQQQQQQLEFVLPSLASHGFGSATGFKATIPQCHALLLSRVLARLSTTTTSVEDNGNRRVASSGTPATTVAVGMESWNLRWYDRPQWTYHAKGIWFYKHQQHECEDHRQDQQNQQSQRQKHNDPDMSFSISPPPSSPTVPFGTYLGSSNMGVRSWYRDFELGFIIVPSGKGAVGTSSTASVSSFGALLQSEVSNITRQTTERVSIERAYASNNISGSNNATKIPAVVIRMVARIIRSYL